jgi:sarcosine oxidase subunit alpha
MTRLIDTAKDISFSFNNKKYKAKEGDTIAAALFANGIRSNRKTFGKNTPRGSFCFMGVCFECLVKINGVRAIQGCRTKLRDGMEIEEDA